MMNCMCFIKMMMLICLGMLAEKAEAERVDLSLLNIHKIGAEKLDSIKQHEKVNWWVEIGDKLVVSLNDSAAKLPAHTQIITTQKGIDLANVAFKSAGHCAFDGGPEASKQQQALTHTIHEGLDAVFSGSGFQLVSIAEVSNKAALFEHPQVMPFEKNKVLLYQIENREIPLAQANDDIAALLAQVDADRYFSHVETLASHDRMVESGLSDAGFWLFDQFEALGLETKMLNTPGQPGFNVLGFKPGTTHADDWFVVGAHLDSRNQSWNPEFRSPGAEDNASGCAGVLEMATVLSQYETASSVLFACFNGEERGLFGSAQLVANLAMEGDLNKVKLMQNMDMIATHPGTEMVMNAGTNVIEFLNYAEVLAANGRQYTDISWQITPNACCTDFISFTQAGVPAVSSTIPDVFGYSGYHRTSDLPVNLDKAQGAGVIKANLATLAALAEVEEIQGFSIVPAHSGMWYNPDQSGHGVTIEILPNNVMLVVWYVFDQVGNQIWLVGVGDYDGNTASIDVRISDQGRFPPEFVTEEVNTTVWGTLNFEFTDCNHVDFSWQPAAGVIYDAGAMTLSRLTEIEGLRCEQ